MQIQSTIGIDVLPVATTVAFTKLKSEYPTMEHGDWIMRKKTVLGSTVHVFRELYTPHPDKKELYNVRPFGFFKPNKSPHSTFKDKRLDIIKASDTKTYERHILDLVNQKAPSFDLAQGNCCCTDYVASLVSKTIPF